MNMDFSKVADNVALQLLKEWEQFGMDTAKKELQRNNALAVLTIKFSRHSLMERTRRFIKDNSTNES